MNERDAYMLARALAEVPRRRRFDYATVSAEALRAVTARPMPPDSYVSQDRDTEAVRDLLAKGYRWVRTEGELAIFEKEVAR
ncbi:MAG: hypothetical protein IAE97_06740 [Chthoniobacterales bacterium]|nr:hypothetical protein [Chthoniobacterales bacterium]